MLSILNNIAALATENALSKNQAAQQKTLTELSTGLRINSGADDAAGLSIVNSLNANVAALTQSSRNVVEGIAQLQTADGALSNVGSLLNRAVTLATEASNGGLTAAQSQALNTEFVSILSEINQIGGATDFNGQDVFASGSASFTSTQASLTASSALTAGAVVTIQDSSTGGNFRFVAGANSTVADLQSAVANAASTGTLSAGTTLSLSGGHVVIATTTPGATLGVSSSDMVLGNFEGLSTSNTSQVFTSDGSVNGSSTITTPTAQPSASSFNLDTFNLLTTAHASSALSSINAAIGTNSAGRGELGASINQLTAQENVENVTVQNLTDTANNIEDADIGKTVSQLTQQSVLQQTGMAALSQANQAQKALLTLLQNLSS